MSSVFRVNEAQVIHEVIDGEAIMINLESGNYYTLNDSGAVVWHFICQSCTAEEAARLTAEYFAVGLPEIEASIATFVQHLVQENLILKINPDVAPPSVSPPVGPAKGTFAPPELTVFTDMQDLLLLDPIHETSEQGWPYAAPPQKVA